VNIYVGNLCYGLTEENLRQAFGAFGQVTSATLRTDLTVSPEDLGLSRCPTGMRSKR